MNIRSMILAAALGLPLVAGAALAAETGSQLLVDAAKLGDMGPMEPFDLVFCDPPYGQGLAEKSLVSARDGKWLAPSALFVFEEAVKAGFKTPEGFYELERRTYDDTEIIIVRMA